VLLIANAVHLHGKWKFPFPEANTKISTFYEGLHPTNTSIIQVPTMSQYNYFRAGIVRSLNAKVLELPFQVNYVADYMWRNDVFYCNISIFFLHIFVAIFQIICIGIFKDTHFMPLYTHILLLYLIFR
jgi:hypothetical protein